MNGWMGGERVGEWKDSNRWVGGRMNECLINLTECLCSLGFYSEDILCSLSI